MRRQASKTTGMICIACSVLILHWSRSPLSTSLTMSILWGVSICDDTLSLFGGRGGLWAEGTDPDRCISESRDELVCWQILWSCTSLAVFMRRFELSWVRCCLWIALDVWVSDNCRSTLVKRQLCLCGTPSQLCWTSLSFPKSFVETELWFSSSSTFGALNAALCWTNWWVLKKHYLYA